MSEPTIRERFSEALFAVFDETFERVQGIYLDRGTSLFETLDAISAETASRPVGRSCASIAAQVNHVCFYLDVLGGYIRQQPLGTIDWAESWRMTAVTADEWDALRLRLRDARRETQSLLRGVETWQGENEIGGALAIVVHTAYHLGEIRQALCTVGPERGA